MRDIGNVNSPKRRAWWAILSQASESSWVTLRGSAQEFYRAPRATAQAIAEAVEQQVRAGLEYYGLGFAPLNSDTAFDNRRHFTSTTGKLLGAEAIQRRVAADEAGDEPPVPNSQVDVGRKADAGPLADAADQGFSPGGYIGETAPGLDGPDIIAVSGGNLLSDTGRLTMASLVDQFGSEVLALASTELLRERARDIEDDRAGIDEVNGELRVFGTVGTPGETDAIVPVRVRGVVTALAIDGPPGSYFRIWTRKPLYKGSASLPAVSEAYSPGDITGRSREYRFPSHQTQGGTTLRLLIPAVIINDEVWVEGFDGQQSVSGALHHDVEAAGKMKVDHLGLWVPWAKRD